MENLLPLMFIIMSLLLMFIAPLFKGNDWLVCLCIVISLVCMLAGIIVPVLS
jgi:hypothetical protein